LDGKVPKNNAYSIDGSITAVAGREYYVEGVAGTTVTLPAAPSNGDFVVVGANANSVTVARNGKTIKGATSDITVDPWLVRKFVYSVGGATETWYVWA
jgi:hypothetical protein